MTDPNYTRNAPPHLALNLGQPINSNFRVTSRNNSSQGQNDGGYPAYENETDERTPVYPTFQDQGDFVGRGPAPEGGRGPSIDETHPNHNYLPTQPSFASLNNNSSSQHPNQPTSSSRLGLQRTLTGETSGSHHSRSPLTTPAMEQNATFSNQPSIRAIKETDFGAHARNGTDRSNVSSNQSPYLGSEGGTTYPPGQYTSIPLDSTPDMQNEKFGSVDERGRKKGVAWGAANRWSRSGTKEEINLSEPNSISSSTNPNGPRSTSRPNSMFRAFGSFHPANGTGTSTPRSEWEGFEFNTAQAKVEDLRYAEGDMGRSKFAKGYFYLLNKSIITRWFLYIVPILILLWIPGIVWLAGVREAKVWSVNLLYWSIWLTVIWVGWWAALAVAMALPRTISATFVAIVPGLRSWVEMFKNLVRNVALIAWTLAIWISFTPLIINHYTGDQAANSRSNLTVFANLLFGLFLCSLVVGGEKLLVQLIAYKFHQDSYEDRIRDQKLQVRSLVTLYINSSDIPGRRDTLTEADMMRRKHKDPKMAIKKALKGFKAAAQTTTTALGNVATEISGQSVLQTNSPYNRVTAALTSASKSKALARRLFYSFRRDGHDAVYLKDISRFFPDEDSAMVAFAVFDRDDNGDATRDEFDMACMQIHREKLALEASMRDLDGAVRRLDDIFMVIVTLIVVLIMAAMVTTKLTTLVTSAGTFVLGLSWLIGTTMQEILGACIFLFVKHPFDVGDRVDFDGQSYVIASMQLMSTTLRRVDGSYTFIGNDILRSKLISNIRRSGPISESFAFDVDFATDFKNLVELRDKMLIFLQDNRRDFLGVFDVVVDNFPEQGKLTLKADIKYKTNWQEGALKVQRRNKWICALKNALADCHIYGPAGAGNPTPDPADPIAYTMVPYEAPATDADGNRTSSHPESPPPDFLAATAGAESGAALLDQQEVIHDVSGDVFDDQVELDDTTAHSTAHAANTPGMAALRQRATVTRIAGEDIEMGQTRRRV